MKRFSIAFLVLCLALMYALKWPRYSTFEISFTNFNTGEVLENHIVYVGEETYSEFLQGLHYSDVISTTKGRLYITDSKGNLVFKSRVKSYIPEFILKYKFKYFIFSKRSSFNKNKTYESYSSPLFCDLKNCNNESFRVKTLLVDVNSLSHRLKRLADIAYSISLIESRVFLDISKNHKIVNRVLDGFHTELSFLCSHVSSHEQASSTNTLRRVEKQKVQCEQLKERVANLKARY